MSKPPPIIENEGEQSEDEKQPDSESANFKDLTVNNENAEQLLKNNMETNNLNISENQSIQTKINNSLLRETYKLENFEKNAMMIFNHENFLVGDRRLGTDLDVAALKDTFKKFRFDVTTHNDLTKQNLFDELEQFSKMDFKDYGCICVAILTHGQDGGFLRAYDTRYRERDAFSCFDTLANPTLVAKPIIFLIQACRGSTAAARVPYGYAQNLVFDGEISESSYRPTEADMIIFHSSFVGRASVRVVKKGSWFIQTLCEQIEQNWSTDHLEELFLRVRQNVAAMEYNGVKQMPAVTTTLLKHLYIYKDVDVTVKTKVKYSEVIKKNASCLGQEARFFTAKVDVKKITLVMFKHAFRYFLAGCLTLSIFIDNINVSTSILIVSLFVFLSIRTEVYKVYVVLFVQFDLFTIFLILFNFFCKFYMQHFKNQLAIPVWIFLFGCWYFIGAPFLIICVLLCFCYFYPL